MYLFISLPDTHVHVPGPQTIRFRTENCITYFQPKHVLLVLQRTVSMRRFFWAPKTHI